MKTAQPALTPIATAQATPPGGHYAQAMVVDNLIFVSGQLGFKPGTSEPVSLSIEEQTQNCLRNLEQILLAANASLQQVVKTTIYISDVAYWPVVNKIYAEIFADHKPARAIIPCNTLHHGFNVEIDAIAALNTK
jgi:2-iminobutanoate/2-iminopropanoate deaminase